MQIVNRFALLTALVLAPELAAAHGELAREPRGVDTIVPAAAAPPADPAAQKITIYTAKTIVTLDPGTPTAQAVAVMNGKILGVGTLDQVRGWVTKQDVEIDRRFQNAVIVPGFIEAHMHPQLTGVLWEGIYVGRFDRTSPDGILVKGLDTKQAVLDRIRDTVAKLPADGRWVIAWGYQPEFYNNSPLTRADLDPISNGHPVFIENLSMHIYYANSKAFELADIKDDTNVKGIVKKDGKPTGEIEEIEAALTFIAKLPPLDNDVLVKATRSAAKLAHRTGVTTFADLSFGSVPGGYKAYQTVAADPDFPLRIVLNPIIQVFEQGEIAQKGGLDYLTELHKSDTDRLSFGGVKFVVDGSIQGYTGLFQWPYYFKTFANGVANIQQDDLSKWVLEVHKRGFQAVIHANADQATEMALVALDAAQRQFPQLATRHRIEHNQYVTPDQLSTNEAARHGDQPVRQPHLLLGRPALFDVWRTGPRPADQSGRQCAAAGHSVQPPFGRVGDAGRPAVCDVGGDDAQDHVGTGARPRRTHHGPAGVARRDARRRLPAAAGRPEGLDRNRQARRFHRARPQPARRAQSRTSFATSRCSAPSWAARRFRRVPAGERRSGRRRGLTHVHPRTDRLGRNGQIDHAAVLRRRGCAGLRRRPRGASALRGRGRAGDRGGLSGHDRGRQGRPQQARGARARRPGGARAGSRRSCIPWCRKPSGGSSRRQRLPATRSRCSTSRCCTRSTATSASTPWWW